jgi:hypothetical protein
MLDPVLLALLQDVLEMVGEVGNVGLPAEGRALLRKVRRLLELRLWASQSASCGSSWQVAYS